MTSTPHPTEDGFQPYTRAERLLNLLMALLGSRVGLNREQIRSVVRGYDPASSPEAFERMFERDTDELRAMGVPVVTLTDPSGVVTGYRIDGERTLPALDLDRAELAVLGLAARMWQSAELAPAAVNALRKVEAQLGMESTPGHATFAGLSADSPVLPVLIAACSSRTPVTFAYRKAGGQPGPRHVQPWGVVWWHAHWYLVGLDTDRGATRVFRASRIEGSVRLEPAGAGYPLPEGFDARAAIGRFAAADRTALRIELAPGVGAALRRAAGAVRPGPDSWDQLDLTVDDLSAGVATVLQYGAAARVVGPPAAVQEADRQLRAVLAAHLGPVPPTAGRGHPVGTGRSAGGAQFARLLALVPWLAANSGVSLRDAAAHFGITEEQLRADLGSVITSGSDDWTLFDIQYWEDDGTIEVIDALGLAEPLTLTPDEGFALVVALDAMAAVPGSHDRSAILSASAKLHTALGRTAPAPGALTVAVDLPEAVVTDVEAAIASGRAVELTYLGAVRDEVTERVVDPIAVVVVDGYAYLRGRCRTADALRLFRLDRIIDLRISALSAEPFADAPADIEPMVVALSETGRRVVVDVPAGSAFPERHPIVRRWALPDGAARLELPVGDYGWARRLVLGSVGEVVLREPGWLVDQVVSDCRASITAP